MVASDITINGIRTPVRDTGPSSGDEAVVFVHGNPGSHEDWADLVERVAPFTRAVAMDMPGFGHADKPSTFPYDVDGYAAHLQAIIEALGIRRVHLVLHDFGGPWGLQWAAKHPDALASATLINTGAFLDYRWHFLARIWRTPKLGEFAMAATTATAWKLLLKIGNPRGVPSAAADRMFAGFDRGTRNAVLQLYRATGNPSAMGYEQCAALRPHDRPALVVWGLADPYLPYKVLAERQREAFPRAEIVPLPGSGHFPFLDNPEAVANVVVPFLKKQTQSHS